MRSLFLACMLMIAALLAGCITLPKGVFTNRFVVTAGEDECMSASRYGPFAITGDVDKRDCAPIVEALRERANARASAAAAAASAASPQPPPVARRPELAESLRR